MIRPLALYIGLRYTRAKRRNHFISFISLASMLGIALGVAVLITVLSVMNGFDYQIRTHFFAIAPEVTVMSNQDVNNYWPRLQAQIDQTPQVVNAAPYVSGMGMLNNQGIVSGVEVVGIIPQEENKVSRLSEKMVKGKLDSLMSGDYHMVIGQQLANRMGLYVGDKVTLFTPQATTTPFGVLPQYRRFTVSGIFNTRSGFGFDSGIVYIHLQDAVKLFPASQGTSGLHVKLKSIYQAPGIANKLQSQLPHGFVVTNWTEQYGPFFNAIAMEKTMMFVILLLIVAVAVFNLVATLVMVVNDKRADIAILRTLGASPRTIMLVFVIQGAVVGLIGTIIGLIGGIILALNATRIVNFIQQIFHVQFIKASVFFVDYLPSMLQWQDIVNVALIAFALSLIATIYPAIVAFRTQPAEALRYE
jgi:lipoprotein-releasing system permease protein